MVHGKLRVRTIQLDTPYTSNVVVKLGHETIKVSTITQGSTFVIDLGDSVTVKAGQSLSIVLS